MKSIKKQIIVTVVVIISFLVTNCSSVKSLQQTDSNGKRVEFIKQGNGGAPTLVFETGMGPTISTWNTIIDSLSQHTNVYAYNRPGYGGSNLKDVPRSVVEVAEQLRINLKMANVPPPYVLVGHSAGGLYVNMFARLYPEETVGVVFIDASHPEQFEYFKTDQQLLYNILITATQKGNRTYEYDLVTTASKSFKNAPRFPEVPISVLTAGKSSPLENKKLRKKWLEFQVELSNLSSISKHLVVEESGHYVHRNEPDLVIKETLRILKTK